MGMGTPTPTPPSPVGPAATGGAELAMGRRTSGRWRPDQLDRRIVALALPALGALVVQPVYSLTDAAIVGHLGTAPLASLALAGGALAVVGWTAGFLQMATVSAVAYRAGAGDDAGAARVVGAAYLVAAGYGVLLSGLLALAAPALVAALGGHGGVARGAVGYLRISALGLVPLLVSLAGNGHLVGLKDTRGPLLVALVANGANVVLEVVLVYPAGLGLAGSAWGTVGAEVVSAALFLRASRRAAIVARRPGARELRRLALDGARLTLRTVALGAALLASTAVAARLGTDALAGHQIALQVWNLLALALDALAVPAQVFVGEALGRSDPGAARTVGRRTLRLGLAAGVAVGVAVVASAWVLPTAFSPAPGVRAEATRALVVCGLLEPAAGLAFVLDGLLLGAARYVMLQRAMLGALVAFAPLAVATAIDHGLGLTGVWLALLCWLAARAGLLGWRWWAACREA
jgi:putative MATE family efflux protein